MPVLPLAPFGVFEASDFHIGGDVSEVLDTGRKWVTFGERALEAAVSLRAINDGGFLGTEGDKYRELVNASMPDHLDITGESHLAVGQAIEAYGLALSDALTQMGVLTVKARGDHGNVQAAIVRYNTAEAALATATVKATAAKTAAVAGSVTPAGPALAGVAVAAETELAAAKAEHTAASAHYQAMLGIWESDLSSAASIKTQLGVDVDTQVGVVDSQARKRFQENPTGLAAMWEDTKAFVNANAEVITLVSDALQIIGSIMLFIPGLQVLGAILIGLGVALKGLLALTGNASWGEFAFDLITSLPGGVIFKALKAGKLGANVAKMAKGASKFGNAALSTVKTAASKIPGKTGQLTRGARCALGLEPVDMATGALVDYHTDVAIDGVLPLVIDRNSNSSHRLGRALGPQWVSRMDCRIEICPDEVLMLSPDGALLTFPPAPVDGSEVRADGRPWLLSYGDGAYRVRDVAAGVVYVFSIAAEHGVLRPTAPLVDGPVEANYPVSGDVMDVVSTSAAGSSVAGHAGMGYEIGLTSMVHRSGQWIEYDYEQSSGHMTRMRRSDGTTLELTWDRIVSRVASIWLTHNKSDTHTNQPGTDDSNLTGHDNEPGTAGSNGSGTTGGDGSAAGGAVRLISYEYDAHGRLRRVINSAAGELAYHYDEKGRVCGWTDRNGVSYTYVFDDQDRVVTQVGTGGMFPNAAVWLDDTAPDAPEGGRVCVAIETATPYTTDPLQVGDAVIPDLLQRLEQLPLVKALRSEGLAAAGLTGCGRDGERNTTPWAVPAGWLYDEVLGDVRPTVYRSTNTGDVWRIITPTGTATDYTYNQYHNVTAVVLPDGSMSSTTYDEDGFIIREVFPDGSEGVVEPAAWGVPARIVARDGLITECEVDLAGNITAVTDPAGLTTRFEYEWRASGVVPTRRTDPSGVTTRIECDDAGRLVATEDAAGRRWSLVRDVAGRVIESMNPIGDVTKVEYSPEGWPWRVTNPDGTTVRATYDGEGNVIQTVNEIGATTKTQYTVFDKPTLITDATGGQTRLLYNSQMDITAVINADGNRWDFTYNLDGQVVEESDYNNLITRFEQDPVQRWSRSIDPAGGETTSWFDPMGRIIHHTDSSGVDTITTYTAQGYVDEIVNNTTALSYSYDDYGRVTAETTTLATGETSTVGVHYDLYGRTNQVDINAAGLVSQQTFGFDDTTGDITTLTAWQNMREVATVGLGTDNAGRRNRITTGSLARVWEFDNRNRHTYDVTYNLNNLNTTNSAHTNSGSGAQGGGVPVGVVAGRMWSWRADNTVTTITDALAGKATFDVDLLGRVTTVTRDISDQSLNTYAPQSGSPVTESYGLSTAGVLTSITAPDYQAEAEEAGLGLAKTPHKPHHHVSTLYNQAQVELHSTLVTRVGKTTYTYDPLGRVITTSTKRLSRKPLVKHFTYHGSGGQIASFTSSDAPNLVWEYAYDGLGRRVAKTCRNTTTGETLSRTIFAHLGDQLIAEHHHGNTNTTDSDSGVVGRVWVTDPGTGEIIGQINHTTTGDTTTNAAGYEHDPVKWSQAHVDAVFYALVADLAGAPQELIHPDTGEIVGKATHTLYGRRKWAGNTTTPLLFAGQYNDNETGLVYNRYRYYDPNAGIYTTQDPLGAGPNLGTPQGYTKNPTTWTDKLGLMSYSSIGKKPLHGDEITSKIREITERPGVEALPQKGKLKQYEIPGGFEQANKDFDELSVGIEPRVADNGTKVAKLDDGSVINVRNKSSYGGPTLEINRTPGSPFRYTKLRY